MLFAVLPTSLANIKDDPVILMYFKLMVLVFFPTLRKIIKLKSRSRISPPLL